MCGRTGACATASIQRAERASVTACVAPQVFEDPELTSSCEEGLNKQLKRTKDGATEQSRIQELAGVCVCACAYVCVHGYK